MGTVQEAKACGKAQHASATHGGSRALEQLLGVLEVSLGDVAMAGEPGRAREVCLRFGGGLLLTRGDQGIASLLESALPALVRGNEERDGAPEHQPGAIQVVAWPDGESLGVVRLSGREGIQCEGSVARVAKHQTGPFLDVRDVSPGCPTKLERRPPVMGEHLGVVVGPAKALDPFGHVPVLCGTVRSGDLPVRHVADEGVGEGELGFALHGRASLPADESLALQRVERGRGVAVPPERSHPEHLPDDGGIAKELLLVPREAVEPCGDDALERFRQAELLGRASLEEQLRELLRVERVASRSLEERLLRVRGEDGPIEEPGDQPRRLLVGERG